MKLYSTFTSIAAMMIFLSSDLQVYGHNLRHQDVTPELLNATAIPDHRALAIPMTRTEYYHCSFSCFNKLPRCRQKCEVKQKIHRAFCKNGRVPPKCRDCCGSGPVDPPIEPPIDACDDCCPPIINNFATCCASCTATASASCKAKAVAKCTAECNTSKRKFLPVGSSSSSSSTATAEATAIAIAEVEANSSSLCGCTHCCCGILQCSANCVAEAMAECQADATASCNASCTATVSFYS